MQILGVSDGSLRLGMGKVNPPAAGRRPFSDFFFGL